MTVYYLIPSHINSQASASLLLLSLYRAPERITRMTGDLPLATVSGSSTHGCWAPCSCAGHDAGGCVQGDSSQQTGSRGIRDKHNLQNKPLVAHFLCVYATCPKTHSNYPKDPLSGDQPSIYKPMGSILYLKCKIIKDSMLNLHCDELHRHSISHEAKVMKAKFQIKA